MYFTFYFYCLISLIVDFPTYRGIYGAGNFYFVGNEFEYSRGIFRYDVVNDAFQGTFHFVHKKVTIINYIIIFPEKKGLTVEWQFLEQLDWLLT